MFKQGFRMIAAVLYIRQKRRWMLFLDSPDGWRVKHDIRRSTASLLDSEPQSMVQSFDIDGRQEVGVFLPEQGEFYALLS